MFVNRKREIDRISKALSTQSSKLIILYGRRRCGKSALLRQVFPPEATYYAADTRETPLQIASLAKLLNQSSEDFDKVIYPDWETLFRSYNRSLKKHTTLCIDEFPYLVKNCPELPSVIQKLTDEKGYENFHLILCGSSQQMMKDVALNSQSPLYGRCDEIIRINPMSLVYMAQFLQVRGIQAIEEYGIWGGVPRYWEIRQQSSSLEEAIKFHVLDPMGVLHDEPERLFYDEMRTSVQAYSIISLIATGSNRLSEIAGKLGKPATQLSRVLAFLSELGYIRREIPFGEPEKTSKKSLYKIDDSFLNFYFTFLVPNKSKLQFGLIDEVWQEIEARLPHYFSEIWEEQCRKVVTFLEIGGLRFQPACRWWGTGSDNSPYELDLVALSSDNSTILIGEVKWSDKLSVTEIENKLDKIIPFLPFAKNKRVIKAAFIKSNKHSSSGGMVIFTPDDINSGHIGSS